MPLPRVTESTYSMVREERLAMSDMQLIKDASALLVDLLPANPLVAGLLTRHHDAAREEFGERGGIAMLISLVSLYRLLEAEQTIRDATAVKSARLPLVKKEDILGLTPDWTAQCARIERENLLLAQSLSITAGRSEEALAALKGDVKELSFRTALMMYSILTAAAERELLESNKGEPV